MANKNFIVKNGITLEGYGQVIDSAGNWTGVAISGGGGSVDSAQVLSIVTADGFTKFDSGNASGLITTAIDNLVDAAPAALDTLNELAAALNDDANFATTVTNSIAALPDSAQVTTIVTNTVDSAYVNARVDTTSLTIGASSTISLDTFVGDSSTTNFTLSQTPSSEQHVLVSINGVIQQTDAYTLSSNTLILSEAPFTSDDIEVRTYDIQSAEVQLRDYKQYVYQPTVTTTTFSGSDINGDVLAYDADKLEVYLNGVQLVNDVDFTAVNGTSVSLLGASPDSGDTVVITSLAKASFTDLGLLSNSASLTTTTASQVVDTFSSSTKRSAKYIVQMSQNSRYHVTELLLTHDGTNVYTTEYGQVITESDLGTIDADINGGTVRLLISPNYTNTSIRTKRIELGV